SLAIFTNISAVLRDTAAFRNSGTATGIGTVPCLATTVRSDSFAACSDRGGSSGEAAIRVADVTSWSSSTARLAAAVSSTSERRAQRVSLAGRLIRVLLMIKRPLDELFQDPAPQFANFLRGSSPLRKLSHAQSCPTRVLMVVALSDIGKRKHAERIERRCSFTQSAAPRWRLIEDEGKSAVEPTNGDERRYRSF